MPTLQVILTAEADGRPLLGSPFLRTLRAPRHAALSVSLPPGGGLPTLASLSGLTQITALVFTATTALTFFLNGQSGEGIPLTAGAVVALTGLTDCDGFPLWSVINTSEDACRIRGVMLGI